VQQQACSTVAEQRGGDKHRRAGIVDTQTQAAEIHCQKQDQCAILGVSETRCAGQARHSGATAEPEHWQSLNRWRQFEPVQQQCIETWNGKSGDRIGHDHIDVVECDSGPLRRFDGYFLKEIERMLAERRGALLPATRL